MHQFRFLVAVIFLLNYSFSSFAQTALQLNSEGYLNNDQSSVFVFSDGYSEGHQGGIQLIHHGERLLANGDLRLEATPGQWQPFSQTDTIILGSLDQSITVQLSYPNKYAAERTFNRIKYPELNLQYTIRVIPEGDAFRILVDLEKPLPREWIGKVGFNLELFPGSLFGKKYYMDSQAGYFPQQITAQLKYDSETENYEAMPYASGKKLVITPEYELQKLTIESENAEIQLLDGRAQHNNGWFIVRSLIPKGATSSAIEWKISPGYVPGWKYGPVIHINQVGYLSSLSKTAIIECSKDALPETAELMRVDSSGAFQSIKKGEVKEWGIHQRYRYFKFDFTEINQEGIYFVKYGNAQSETFLISTHAYNEGVWQPTLDYFLPVQMCHMRVNDRYRVWHGLCHMDDATMAPTNLIHFDGYQQGSSTLTTYEPGQHVPNLNSGGWHDAGDYDLRVESQGGTVHALSLIWEAFKPEHDMTTILQEDHLVELRLPDGKPDILQQIEHGTLTLVNAYNTLGRLYRGIICNDLRQYVLLGDGSTMTDNVIFNNGQSQHDWLGRVNDDRWVFTEDNPRRELQVCAHLASAYRSLKHYNDTLANQALEIAQELYKKNSQSDYQNGKIIALTELILSTGLSNYTEDLKALYNEVGSSVPRTGWAVCRVLEQLDDLRFERGFMLGVQKYFSELRNETASNPFGVPYHPRIWGSAWGIEQFGVHQYYFHKTLEIEDAKAYMINALNYVLGLHPGENTASFVSGVGTNSATVAYGINRADWSYIPGGVISGTATIKPDFPELKTWPFLWQQTEYVIGGAASNFMFLVLGALEVSK